MTSKTKKIYDYIIFWTSVGLYTFVFIYICTAYLKNSVLHFKYANPHIISTIYPIRWDFYTGSPDEPIYRMYKIQNNKLVPYDVRPFTARFLFGLKRDSKVIISELANIATDTAFMSKAGKYIIKMPVNGDINNYIHPDTLKYNNYHSQDVIYLKGQLLMSIGECPTWQDQRSSSGALTTDTLIPLNIIDGK